MKKSRILELCCLLFILVPLSGLYVIGCSDSGTVTGNPVNPSQPTAVPPQKGNIIGTLLNSQGNPMGNLMVILRAALGSPEIARTTTDSNGNFSFSNITVGSYILEALNSAGAVIASANTGVNANSTTNSQIVEGTFLPTPTPTSPPTSTPDPRTPTIFIPPPPPPGSTSTPTPTATFTGTPPTSTPTPTATGPTPTRTNTPVVSTRQPRGIAITGSGRVYVAEYKSNTVAYFLPGATTASHVSTGIGTNPEWITTTNNNQVFVTNFNSANISQITDGDSTGRIIPLPSGTHARKPMGITTDNTSLYIVDNNNADLLVIPISQLTTPLNSDPNTYTKVYNIPNATNARYIGYYNNRLYITADNKIVILTAANPLTDPNSVAVGSSPMDIDIGSMYALTGNFGSNNASIMVTGTNAVSSFATGNQPYGVDIFYDLTGVFVANMLSNTITRADINGTVSDFTITGGTLNDPYDLTSSAVDANYLYVTNSEGDNVFRINTGTRHVDTITNLKP